ncbi:MAG TPA: S1 RNA-binding domain-containing protein [Chloroflexota bacterium]|nr:S1 RNA-binding domain-containing protein [Chloroflexota bacterium]
MRPGGGDARDMTARASGAGEGGVITTDARADGGSSSADLLADDDMERLMAAAEQEYRTLHRGDVVEGVVVSIDRDGILVDIGAKSEGLIPASDAQRFGDGVSVGETILAVVVQPEGPGERVTLSLARARSERGWRTVQAGLEAGTIFTGRVVETNRGGLVVAVAGLRGFLPLSQIASVRVNGLEGEQLEQALGSLVGRDLSVKVLEVNRRRNRLILSERLAVQELRQQRRDQLIAELKEGEIRTGRVTRLCDFGAFVDLGGADGLVHVSELAWHQVGHPSEVVQVGDEVQVYVLGVDPVRRKISLSIRRAHEEPWATAAERYPVGSLVTARITRLTTFGAFAQLEDGIEGLIHVSELSDRRVAHPRNVVSEGDDVTVRVLRVEPERHRLGLSLRQVDPADQVHHSQRRSGQE